MGLRRRSSILFSIPVLPTSGLQHPRVPLAHRLSSLPQNPRHTSHQALPCRLIMAQDRSKGLPPKTLSALVASPSLNRNSWLLRHLHLACSIASSQVSWGLGLTLFLPSMPLRFGKLSIMATSSHNPCSLSILNAISTNPSQTLLRAVPLLLVEQTRVCTRVLLST